MTILQLLIQILALILIKNVLSVHFFSVHEEEEYDDRPFTTAPNFQNNTIPREVLCLVNRTCHVVLPVGGAKSSIPSVENGYYDPGLQVQPLQVWHKLPFLCEMTSTSCPFEAIVSVTPTEAKLYRYCVQTKDEHGLTTDELCFFIKGSSEKIAPTTNFLSPPTLPANSTVVCPSGQTCHYQVEVTRHGGSCKGSLNQAANAIIVNITLAEVKQLSCKYDVAYQISAGYNGIKTLCVMDNTSNAGKHCTTIEFVNKNSAELHGPCSSVQCYHGGVCVPDTINNPQCICSSTFTGLICDQNVTCDVMSPYAVSCSASTCDFTFIVVGSRPSLVSFQDASAKYEIITNANDSNEHIIHVKYPAVDNPSNICFDVFQRFCHRNVCVVALPEHQHQTPNLFSNLTNYKCDTSGICYLSVLTNQINGICPSLSTGARTSVGAVHIFPSTLQAGKCASTIAVIANKNGTEEQQVCLNTGQEMRCISISFKDRQKCSGSPCKNGGTCEILFAGYRCMCAAGWQGTNCSNNVDECLSNPCMNGGSCLDLVGDFNCTCAAGWEGKTCLANINECLLVPNACENGGICFDIDGGYTCTCAAGWEGKNCSQNINDCLLVPNACENGGTCVDLLNGYNCTCTSSWEGRNCSQNINDCLLVPNACENGGTCVDLLNGYNCTCASGWEGKNCSQNINDCLLVLNACENGGTCVDLVNGYNCTCASGWEGKNCSQNINDCSIVLNACENGGTCVDLVNGYNCTCASGWEGKNCSQNIDDCSNVQNVCANGGTCIDLVDGYNCTCAAGWEGVNCEHDIDYCASNPCQNNGTCWDGASTHKCTCTPGYTGDQCEKDVDECESVLCANGATCIDLHNSFTCSCLYGFTGKVCEIKMFHCTGPECLNGGTCINGSCHCQQAFIGEHCQTYLDPCLSDPCFNGTCFHHQNDFYCDCPPGYVGKTCQLRSCEPTSCHNGGTCEVSVGHVICHCPLGFTGSHCETDINECLPSPCQNGGNCVDVANGFLCECPVGYGGYTCNTVTDVCLTHPCVHGTCYSHGQSFHCDCPAGFTGKVCDTAIAVQQKVPQNITINVSSGREIMLNCSHSGDPSAFNWTKLNGCGGVYESATGPVLHVSQSATVGDTGVYVCTPENGTDQSATVTFNVNVESKEAQCDFDSQTLCGWVQLKTDNFDWTFQQGPTQSDNTGPNNDHTTGNGNYLYVESSSPRVKDDYASLASYLLPANYPMCFEFWYYLYGDGIGNITVYLQNACTQKETTIFQMGENKGEQWLKASLNIPGNLIPNDYRIIVKGDIGPSYTGDAAIDDFLLSSGECATTRGPSLVG